MVRFFIKIVILILLSNKVYAEQIDICEDNYSCKKTYQYNYLDFNFNSGVIEHRYKFSPEFQKNFQSYYEIERKFKIIKIDEDGITFDQSFKSHFELQHKMFLDDKYLIGSNFYKNTFEKKVNESGGAESSWYRVKIFPKEKIIEEIYWPLTQEPQKKIINLVFTEGQFLENEQRQEIAKIIVFVASVYLYSRALDKIKTTNTSQKNVNTPSTPAGNQGNVSNPYTPEWAKPNRFTPSWALPPAQKADRLNSYLMGRRLFP